MENAVEMLYWFNLICFVGFLVSAFYGILALNSCDDEINWSDIAFVLLASLLSWCMASAFFVGYNVNKNKMIK
jgi:hypothetical protein